MSEFITGPAARERFGALLDAVDDAYTAMRGLSSDEVGAPFRVEMAERLETQARVNRGLMYRVFGELADPPDDAGARPGWRDRVAARLRITRGEITRRVRVAATIRPRRALSGETLQPQRPVVADALAAGVLGEDHLRVISGALNRLPSCVSVTERTEVEASLVGEAAKQDADFVAAVGRALAEVFNPDGFFDDQDRQRRRGVTVGNQQTDGMSPISGWVDPELRSYIEATTAAVRPGRHLPEGATCDEGDDRSPAQRCHDGITLGLKAGIASGDLGPHRGAAVSVIARTTLGELEQAARAAADPQVSMPSPARTGGGSALPMRDLIRMAAGAVHYLAIFDDHTERPLYLGRSKRIATADQRIICYARDGGCTRPGCTEPGYHCEVHHGRSWAAGGASDADNLWFGCEPDHDALTNGRYHTEVIAGRLAWSDGDTPPQINRAHHPDELLRGDPSPPGDPDPPSG